MSVATFGAFTRAKQMLAEAPFQAVVELHRPAGQMDALPGLHRYLVRTTHSTRGQGYAQPECRTTKNGPKPTSQHVPTHIS